MSPPPIYLDHNATAPMLPEVADAVREASLRYPGNPASQHEAGRAARRALEAARERIAELLGASTAGMEADRVVFTSGGTEANNLALAGLLPKATDGIAGRGARVLISALEHPSIARMAEHLATSGTKVDVIPANVAGIIDLHHLEKLLNAHIRAAGTCELPIVVLPPALVSIMLASNETGVLQNIAEAAVLCRRGCARIHTDATQAVGKIPVNFRALGVDALTLAAHKFHGPVGIGALIVRHGVSLTPSLHGGFQQSTLRPGTESVALAVGMVTALELWHAEADARRERMTSLRDQFERELRAGFPAAVVIGADAPRLPHVSNVALVGLDRQALLMALDLAGVTCSTGSACASGSSEPSPSLLAMGLPDEVISSSLRFSFGAASGDGDAAEAARRILSVCNRLRRQK